MIVFPKAKINLGLRIIRKRPDGYHDIETLFYPIGLSDALEFVVTDEREDELTVSGIATTDAQGDNLVMKTINKLRENYSFPILKTHLHKAIPLGAGLGGGSSDAACLLKVLNRCFNLSIDEEVLKAIALDLGSDCPFFIEGTPAFGTGRGEILTPCKPVLKGFYLLLLNPGIGISTKEAFNNCHPENPVTTIFQLTDHPVAEWKELIINDFEDYAFRIYPLLAELKGALYNSGAIFSSMSGSGSSIYGIFKEKPVVPDKLKEFVIWQGIL
jgi:4-diphosphocytidyl-2-C-methyl-D-erythritol kinase